jgi:hypothetical protein
MDMIIGLNVVHTSQIIENPLIYFKQALVKNGILMVIEPTNVIELFHFVFGVFKDWWNFQDSRKICCLNNKEWEIILKKNNFSKVKTLTLPNHVHSIIIATNSEYFESEKIENNISIYNESDPLKLIEFIQNKLKNKDLTPLIIKTYNIRKNDIKYSQILGATRVIINEINEFKTKFVDFDSNISKENEEKILKKISNNFDSFDSEIYIDEKGEIYVTKLIPIKNNEKNLFNSNSKCFRLEIDSPGILNTLNYRNFNLPEEIEKNDVICKVKSASLNFKDLMIAMNLLKLKKKPLGIVIKKKK